LLHHHQQSEDGFATLIERYSVKGDTVCDPFCGSGTTGVAAVKLGRRFIGVDVDPRSIAVAAKRMHEATRTTDARW